MEDYTAYCYKTVKELVDFYKLKEEDWDIVTDSMGNESFYAESWERDDNGIAVHFAIELAPATELELLSDFSILYRTDLQSINKKTPLYSLRLAFI